MNFVEQKLRVGAPTLRTEQRNPKSPDRPALHCPSPGPLVEQSCRSAKPMAEQWPMITAKLAKALQADMIPP